MSFIVSLQATNQIMRINTKKGYTSIFQILVDTGGCNGLNYDFKFIMEKYQL